MYTTLILSVHVVVAFSIIGLVLIQHGKGADAGAAFGGGGGAGGASGSVFGAQGSSNFLSRTTGILAAIFFSTSLAMAYLTTSGHEAPISLMEESRSGVSSEIPSVVPIVPAADVPADVPGMSAPESPNAEMPSSGSTTSNMTAAESPKNVTPGDVPSAPK